ncbi:ATP synthase subunit AtpR [Alcaligenaceae bacterium]|nr:ATP synthase subunit AtpR [Alcaligenaceae bacterium]
MINIDWSGFLLGMLMGLVFSALFFAGLAWGMKLALRRTNSAVVLLSSAALRIAALLAGGWLAAAWLGIAGAVGFAAAFIVLRTILLSRLRATQSGGV